MDHETDQLRRLLRDAEQRASSAEARVKQLAEVLTEAREVIETLMGYIAGGDEAEALTPAQLDHVHAVYEASHVALRAALSPAAAGREGDYR